MRFQGWSPTGDFLSGNLTFEINEILASRVSTKIIKIICTQFMKLLHSKASRKREIWLLNTESHTVHHPPPCVQPPHFPFPFTTLQSIPKCILLSLSSFSLYMYIPHTLRALSPYKHIPTHYWYFPSIISFSSSSPIKAYISGSIISEWLRQNSLSK